MTVISAIFRIRRDTAANWTSANPVLKLGEPGLETDTRRVKYGDGSTAWTSLGYGVGDPRAGTSFPGSPATGTRFTRTDRNIEYFYDGTRWLSTQEHQLVLPSLANVTATATGTSVVNPYAGRSDIYVTAAVFTNLLVGTGNWTAKVIIGTTGGGSSDLTNANSGAFTNTALAAVPVTVNTLVSSAVHSMALTLTENSGTAAAYSFAAVIYRLVG